MTPAETRRARRRAVSRGGGCAGGAVHVLGLIGALVYFWQSAEGLGEHVVAVLKSLVWPAFLVYQAFGALAGS